MFARTATVLSLFALLATAFVFLAEDASVSTEAVTQTVADLAASAASEREDATKRESIDDVQAVVGLYGASVGSRFGYAFEHKSTYSLATLDAQGRGTQQGEPVTIPVVGRLDMQVIGRTADTITIRVQGRDVKTPVAGQPDARGKASLAAFRAVLTNWFLVRIDAQGKVLGYAFQKGPRATERNFVRAVVAGFFHHAIEGEVEWQAAGQDATGDYVADYRRLTATPWTVERRKTHYTQIGREAVPPKHELSGRSQASFADGWLDAVQVDETTTLEVVEFPSRVTVHVAARFERVASSWAGVELERSQWPVFVAASGAGENLAADSKSNERDRWAAKLADVSVEELIEALRALLGDTRSAEFYAAWETLSWKLKLDATAVTKVQEQLLHGAFGEKLGSMVLSALGKAGSEEAQGALLAVFGSQGLDGGWRETAAIAMFQLEQPSAAVIEAIGARASDLQEIDQLDATSMLLFGALAPRRAAPMANGRSALAQLLSLESRSTDPKATGLWLDALGNAAVPAVAKHAARYLGHDDALIRESAVVAMDRSGAPGVAGRLIPLAEKDPSRDVRIRAIEAIGKRGDAKGRAAIRSLAVESRDAGVRRAAVQALGARELTAADRRVLRRVAHADKAADLRQAAQQILAGRR